VWWVLPKRCEILIFLVQVKRGMCEEKWIWRLGLTFFVTFFVKEKNVKETNIIFHLLSCSYIFAGYE
jgi:hypothetical protein